MGIKTFLAVTASALALTAGSAWAADLGGSIKDGPVDGYGFKVGTVTWEGTYIGAYVGYGWGEFEGSRDVTRSVKEFKNSSCTYTPESGTETTEYGLTKDACAALDAKAEFSPREDDKKPLGTESAHESGKLDMDGWFGGGELSYKIRRGNIIFEPFADASFGGGSASVNWERQITSFTDGNGVPHDITDAKLMEDGSISIKKRWGADVGLKAGLLLTPRDYVYGLGGLSYGSFRIKGGSSLSGGDPTWADYIGVGNVAYSENDSAWGWTVGAGYERALTDNLHFGVEGRYTQFDNIGASASKTTDVCPVGCPGGVNIAASDGVRGDYSQWSVLGRLSYRLGN